ncbi:hypothetical protein HON52_03370 [Candidatus Uhrbacteria bacterium]|jgi:diacylglycerol kinase family enzyme|nr:hypothetical protein [Candidatus Uhrbacteria bacterium]
MYYYVYDEFVQDPKFERELSAIETRLTDLGIAGKIARLALFRDPKELIRDEIRKGAKTIVAIGNDLTLRKVIDAVADRDVVVGMIPFGKDNNVIADLIGMPGGVESCDVLSARILQELDLGMVNSRRFLHTVVMQNVSKVEIECDRDFTISPFRACEIVVRNLAMPEDDVRAADPTDGRLEVVVRVPQRSWFGAKKIATTVVPVKRAVIRSATNVAGAADGEAFEGNEFIFESLPRQVRVITGRARKF